MKNIFSKLLPLKEEKIIEGLVANVERKPVHNENDLKLILYCIKDIKCMPYR